MKQVLNQIKVTDMRMHIHTWSLCWRNNGNCSKRPSRSCSSSRIALCCIANVRSIKSVTTWWLWCALVNSTWSNRQCLSKDTESSPGAGKGCASDCVIPGPAFVFGRFFCIRLQLSPFNWCCSKFFETVSQRGYISTSKSNAQKTNII